MKIKEVEIKVHYGMTALSIFFDKVQKLNGRIYSKKQIAAIIWAGYIGYCEREDLDEELVWQDVYDYVDKFKLSDEDNQDILKFTTKFHESQQLQDVKNGLEETKEEIEDLKKKQEQAIGENLDIKQD